MNITKITRCGATIITSAAILAGAAPADAKPSPYERRAVDAIKAREGTIRGLVVNLPRMDVRGRARDLHPYSKG